MKNKLNMKWTNRQVTGLLCGEATGLSLIAFAILTVFVLSHAISTQHPETFQPASPLFFKTFHPASTRYYTH